MSAHNAAKQLRNRLLNILVIILALTLCITQAYAGEKTGKSYTFKVVDSIEPKVEISSSCTTKDKPAQNKAENNSMKNDVVKKLTPDSTLTIEQAVKLAMQNNLQLKAKSEDINQARSQFDQVKSTLNIKSRLESRTQLQGPKKTIGDIAPIEIPDNLPISSSTIINWGFDSSGRVVIEKILTSFGKIEHQKAAAFIKIQAEQQGLTALENNISFQVKQVFYNILKAQEALKIANEFTQLTGDYEELAKKHYKAGIVSKYDVLRAGVSVAEARRNVISAIKGVELSKSILLTLIDQRKSIPFDIEAPPQVFLDGSVTLEQLQKSALDNRSEIKEINTYIKIAQKMIDAAKSSNKPDVVTSGEYGMQANPMGKGVMSNYAWNVGVSLRIPLFDGGETKAKVSEAESKMKALKINHDALSEQIRLQVKEAWLDYLEAKATVDVVHSQLIQSRESYRLAKARYTEGVSIAVEMDDALVSYKNAQKNLLNAMHDLNLAYASLERAVGRKIEGTNITIMTPPHKKVKGEPEAKNDEK